MGKGERMEEREEEEREELRLELGHECGRLSLYGACADRSRDLPYRGNQQTAQQEALSFTIIDLI